MPNTNLLLGRFLFEFYNCVSIVLLDCCGLSSRSHLTRDKIIWQSLSSDISLSNDKKVIQSSLMHLKKILGDTTKWELTVVQLIRPQYQIRIQNISNLNLIVGQNGHEIWRSKINLLDPRWPLYRSILFIVISFNIKIERSVTSGDDKGIQELIVDRCWRHIDSWATLVESLQHILSLFSDIGKWTGSTISGGFTKL